MSFIFRGGKRNFKFTFSFFTGHVIKELKKIPFLVVAYRRREDSVIDGAKKF